MFTLSLPSQSADDIPDFDEAIIALRDKVVRQIEPELRRQLHADKGQSLYLDMEAVEFVTASGLSDLLALHQEIRDAGGHLALCNVNPGPFEVFRLCRMVDVLDIRAKTVHHTARMAC